MDVKRWCSLCQLAAEQEGDRTEAVHGIYLELVELEETLNVLLKRQSHSSKSPFEAIIPYECDKTQSPLLKFADTFLYDLVKNYSNAG